MTTPVVEVIIPVHTPERPIERATASVLTTNTTDTRVTVVCHNVAIDAIGTALGSWRTDPRVNLLSLHDGIASPAGPINAGLEVATGEFTALLGSDDEYEAGAVDAWVAVARRDTADVVIAPTRAAPGHSVTGPPTRPLRRRQLDGVRDRLAYQTVQLGLVSRAKYGHIRMTPELRTGEDVIQGVSLWFSGASISYARGAPAYLIHTDSEDSASTSPKPAAESLTFLDAVLAPDFVETLTLAQREAFAIKLLRTHVMDILGAALRAGSEPSDLSALADGVTRIVALAPSATSILSKRDARIISELLDRRDAATLTAEHAIRTDFRRVSNVAPASATRLFHREAPPRFLTAIALTR